ncbi:Hydrogenase isoenzymes formation protein HypC [Rubripirellula tenax]|uniref:Hydrogenase isoenzymes formation protein HypC n=1 Tax=Rubripirellula tenax TaxID=2528015 RepID=A0A5C6ESY9_9BACT|nr:HypC/HybG/HupF family hydrogenase formation chaperone [Rubripirellula tenax]TWU50569.1 Hydrogenase isoenzymes formation protein HypC [Rubripirellula tenax]
MCLGIPGQVIRWIDRDPTFAKAEVEFGGVLREVHMACVPEANEGQYVIVHAGIAICIVDEAEAAKTLAEYERMKHFEENGDEVPR